MNIFVLTDKPEKAFEACRALIRSARISSGLAAGYRETSGNEYVRLWPADSSERFEIR